jgi:hypothetical protein
MLDLGREGAKDHASPELGCAARAQTGSFANQGTVCELVKLG